LSCWDIFSAKFALKPIHPASNGKLKASDGKLKASYGSLWKTLDENINFYQLAREIYSNYLT